jgi:hypothetical protein
MAMNCFTEIVIFFTLMKIKEKINLFVELNSILKEI